jgi:hypothetical protein
MNMPGSLVRSRQDSYELGQFDQPLSQLPHSNLVEKDKLYSLGIINSGLIRRNSVKSLLIKGAFPVLCSLDIIVYSLRVVKDGLFICVGQGHRVINRRDNY